MPQRYTSRIMKFLSKKEYKPIRRTGMLKALKVDDANKGILYDAIQLLHDAGRIKATKDRPIELPDMPSDIEGRFQSTRKGFGFVIPKYPYAQGDVRIAENYTRDAVSGDEVICKVIKCSGDRASGRITSITNRIASDYVGTIEYYANQWVVVPDGKQTVGPVEVDDIGAKNCDKGDKVIVEITRYPFAGKFAQGVIVKKLGKGGKLSVELISVMHRYGLEDKFPKKVIAETREAVRMMSDTETPGDREDIRDLFVLTIDPETARDFDDAISLTKNEYDHWRLGVHIADVSHFIPLDSELDKEAISRGTSVYLPNHVVPMLPEQLSNGVCSLQENEDRFAKTAYITFDDNGYVVETSFANSLIRSSKRLTYEDADRIIAGKTADYAKKVVKMVENMHGLAKQLQARRQKSGMLSLDLPSAQIVFDKRGGVKDVQLESTTFSHTMIEMFMLEGNEAVARLFDSLNVPFMRRVHPEPDAISSKATASIVKACGYMIPNNVNRQGMQDLLNNAKGKPESFVINLAVLKSLQRAEYSPVEAGHFALASEYYCHFTSPIRRYPDLLIHRLLQQYIEGSLPKQREQVDPDYDQLTVLGEMCSDKERNAESAERDLKEFLILQMLEKHQGDQMKGVVTSITNFGIFVQVEKYLVEGLIRADDLRHLMPKDNKQRVKHHRRGRGGRDRGGGKGDSSGGFINNCPFRIGESVKVSIASVNSNQRMLDLAIVE